MVQTLQGTKIFQTTLCWQDHWVTIQYDQPSKLYKIFRFLTLICLNKQTKKEINGLLHTDKNRTCRSRNLQIELFLCPTSPHHEEYLQHSWYHCYQQWSSNLDAHILSQVSFPTLHKQMKKLPSRTSWSFQWKIQNPTEWSLLTIGLFCLIMLSWTNSLFLQTTSSLYITGWKAMLAKEFQQ